MFKRKPKQSIELNLDNKDINPEQLVVGNFWSGTTLEKSILSESLSIKELKYIANEYEKLVRENADLIHFKEVALKHLTRDQLEAIKEELENIPETDY